jgi:hypothetical protein
MGMDSENDDDNALVRAHLIIHYIREKRFQINKKAIHQLWNQLFQQTPVIETRRIVGHRNNRNLTKELVHRRQKRQQNYNYQ